MNLLVVIWRIMPCRLTFNQGMTFWCRIQQHFKHQTRGSKTFTLTLSIALRLLKKIFLIPKCSAMTNSILSKAATKVPRPLAQKASLMKWVADKLTPGRNSMSSIPRPQTSSSILLATKNQILMNQAHQSTKSKASWALNTFRIQKSSKIRRPMRPKTHLLRLPITFRDLVCKWLITQFKILRTNPSLNTLSITKLNKLSKLVETTIRIWTRRETTSTRSIFLIRTPSKEESKIS